VPKLVVLLEQLLAPVPGGTGRYSRELTAALAATAPAGWTVGGAIARHADPTPAVIPGVEGPHRLPLPRVLIDATAVPTDRGAVGRYVDCLVAALDADGAAPMVVCQPRDAQLYATLAPHADVVPAVERLVARTARLTWEQTTLPWLVHRARVDVLHCPHYTMPLALPAATVVTLHDATFLH
jgi:hypothetical protein